MRNEMSLFVVCVLALGCRGCREADDDSADVGLVDDSADGDDSGDGPDADGDGVADALDCAPEDASVAPGLPEACDGLDTDCDPSTGEDGLVSLGGASFDTVQSALDAAQDGDEVWVCAGTWTENLSVASDLTLRGAGADLSVIDGGGVAPALAVRTGVTLSLVGLTFQNGSGGRVGGGGVRGDVARALTLESCRIVDNVAGQGAGIVGRDGLTLIDTVVSGNTASIAGGGIYIELDGGALTLNNSEISGNSAPYGGGMDVEIMGPGSAVVGDGLTQISGNQSSASGGGLYAVSPRGAHTFDISGLNIVDNAAEDAAGMLVGYGSPSLTNIVVSGNSAVNFAGGAYLAAAEAMTLSGVTVSDNDAGLCGGGLLVDFMIDGASIDGGDTPVTGNSAPNGGGLCVGMYAGLAEGETALLASLDLRDNSADDGGGAMVSVSAGTVTLQGLIIADNIGEATGGVAVSGSGLAVLDGVEITGNRGEWGGVGVFTDVEIVGGEVWGNTGVEAGGALVYAGNLSVSGVDWLGDSANAPDDVHVGGKSYSAEALGDSFTCSADSGLCSAAE